MIKLCWIIIIYKHLSVKTKSPDLIVSNWQISLALALTKIVRTFAGVVKSHCRSFLMTTKFFNWFTQFFFKCVSWNRFWQFSAKEHNQVVLGLCFNLYLVDRRSKYRWRKILCNSPQCRSWKKKFFLQTCFFKEPRKRICNRSKKCFIFDKSDQMIRKEIVRNDLSW